MTPALRVLSVWLTPAVALTISALIVERGADGLWVGLAVVLALLIALGLGGRPTEPLADSSRGTREPLLAVVTLLLVVAVLLWANIVLAGSVAAWLGAPRWQGIAATAAGGWALTVWRGARRTAPLLLLLALAAAALPLVALARVAAVGPLGAWQRVATQTAFRFPPSSPWVNEGRDLARARGSGPLVFDEEHRITAAASGVLHARTRDGGRPTDLEWELSPGQSVTLRPGDELARSPSLRVRFEAGKRVPGAPPSGTAWAQGGRSERLPGVGLVMTLVMGAVALLGSGTPVRVSRTGVALVGAGLVGAFLWAQGWAVYSVLGAPDLFLGGVTPERLLELPGAALLARPWRRGLQALLLLAGAGAFLASSVALRERLGALDRTGGGEIGHDLGLWGGVFGVAAVASLWPVDPWALTLLALGAAASALAPALLCPPPPDRPAAVTGAGLVGLTIFGVLAAAQLRGGAGGLLGVAMAYPALAAVPAGICVLWMARWGARR